MADDSPQDLPQGEPQDLPPEPPQDGPRYFTEDEFNQAVEQARAEAAKQAKPQVSRADERYKQMQAELKELKAAEAKRAKAEAKRQQEIEAERKRAEEAEMSARELIDRRQAEWDAKLAQMQADAEQREAVYKRELEFMQLSAYARDRIAAEGDDIAPELQDYITGSTREEIDAAIEKAKAKTAAILENVRQAGVRQRASMPGTAPSSGATGITPGLDGGDSRELTADDIRNMPMDQFAELRSRLGMGGGGQGLFS